MSVLGYWTNLCISNVPGKKVPPVWNYASCATSSARAEDPLRALYFVPRQVQLAAYRTVWQICWWRRQCAEISKRSASGTSHASSFRRFQCVFLGIYQSGFQ